MKNRWMRYTVEIIVLTIIYSILVAFGTSKILAIVMMILFLLFWIVLFRRF